MVDLFGIFFSFLSWILPSSYQRCHDASALLYCKQLSGQDPAHIFMSISSSGNIPFSHLSCIHKRTSNHPAIIIIRMILSLFPSPNPISIPTHLSKTKTPTMHIITSDLRSLKILGPKSCSSNPQTPMPESSALSQALLKAYAHLSSMPNRLLISPSHE